MQWFSLEQGRGSVMIWPRMIGDEVFGLIIVPKYVEITAAAADWVCITSRASCPPYFKEL